MENAIDIVENVFLGDLNFVGLAEVFKDFIGDCGSTAVAVNQFSLLLTADEFPFFRFVLLVKVERKALTSVVHMQIRYAISNKS